MKDGISGGSAHPQPEGPERVAWREPIGANPIRVRVVGNDPGSVDWICHLLEGLAGDPLAPPIDLEAAVDGIEPTVTAVDVDAILLDVDPMTEELLRHLTAIRQQTPDLPLIGLLGETDRQVERVLTKAGVTACFPKDRILGERLPQALAEARRLRARVAAGVKALEESERRFRDLVEASTDGLIVIDPLGRVAFANPAAADMFGQRVEELVGSEFGHPVSGGTTEIDIVRGDPCTGVAEMRVVPLRWNERQAWLALLHDVTR